MLRLCRRFSPKISLMKFLLPDIVVEADGGVFKTKNPAGIAGRIFHERNFYRQAPALLIRKRGMGGNDGLYQSTSTMICLVTSACLL